MTTNNEPNSFQSIPQYSSSYTPVSGGPSGGGHITTSGGKSYDSSGQEVKENRWVDSQS
jgi:hypothetical protein